MTAAQAEIVSLKSRLESQVKGIADLELEIDNKHKLLIEEKSDALIKLRESEDRLKASHRKIKDLEVKEESYQQEYLLLRQVIDFFAI